MVNLLGSETLPDSTTTLVVILHGWTVTPAFMVHVKNSCRQSMPAAEILVPPLPLGFWSSVNPVKIARDVISAIDSALSARQAKGGPPFEDIVLIGHSVGGLIARKVYVLAGPESDEARFEDSLPELRPCPCLAMVRKSTAYHPPRRDEPRLDHIPPFKPASCVSDVCGPSVSRICSPIHRPRTRNPACTKRCTFHHGTTTAVDCSSPTGTKAQATRHDPTTRYRRRSCCPDRQHRPCNGTRFYLLGRTLLWPRDSGTHGRDPRRAGEETRLRRSAYGRLYSTRTPQSGPCRFRTDGGSK